jgi:hypothetical protein
MLGALAAADNLGALDVIGVLAKLDLDDLEPDRAKQGVDPQPQVAVFIGLGIVEGAYVCAHFLPEGLVVRVEAGPGREEAVDGSKAEFPLPALGRAGAGIAQPACACGHALPERLGKGVERVRIELERLQARMAEGEVDRGPVDSLRLRRAATFRVFAANRRQRLPPVERLGRERDLAQRFVDQEPDQPSLIVTLDSRRTHPIAKDLGDIDIIGSRQRFQIVVELGQGRQKRAELTFHQPPQRSPHGL